MVVKRCDGCGLLDWAWTDELTICAGCMKAMRLDQAATSLAEAPGGEDEDGPSPRVTSAREVGRRAVWEG